MLVRSLLTLLGFEGDTNKLQKYGNALNKIVSIGKLATGAMLALTGVSLKAAGDMEQVQIAFETMLGSAEAADDLIRDITEFAASTPFELTGLVDSSKQLLAFGFTAEEIIPTMTTMGNIAAGVGRDKLPTIVRSLGKIRTKGKASMEELNMMLEAGVPILDTLSKNLGVNNEELAKMISAGKVGFDDVNEALFDLGNGTGLFGGLMEKQSKSFLGILSNIGDWFTNFMVSVGGELLPIGKELGKAFLEFLEANRDIMKSGLVAFFKGFIFVLAFIIRFIQRLIEHFGGLSEATLVLQSLFKGLGKFFAVVANIIGKGIIFIIGLINDVVDFLGGWEFILETVLPIVLGIVSAFAALQIIFFLMSTANPFAMLLIGIFLIIAAIQQLRKNWDAIVNHLKGIWDGFTKSMMGAWQQVVNGVLNVVKAVVKLWNAFLSWWGKLWDSISKTVGDVWNIIVEGVKKGWEGLTQYIMSLWQGILDFIESIKEFGEGIAGFFTGIFGGGASNNAANNASTSTTNNNGTNINVNSKVNLGGVPAGTSQEQAEFLKSEAQKVVQKEWESISTEIIINNPY